MLAVECYLLHIFISVHSGGHLDASGLHQGAELDCFFAHNVSKLRSFSSNLKITTDLMSIKMNVLISKL